MTDQTLNQYAAPQAHVADVNAFEGGTGELKVFSSEGRIGRLRYLAWSMAAGLINALVSVVMTFALSGSSALFMLFNIVAFVAALWFSVIIGIKRCHDMNISGWWTLTIIFPLIVFLWILVPGSKTANRFGPPPPPNNWGVRILGLLFPVIAGIGLIAAVALPAYSSYVNKARAAQAQQAQPAQQQP
ncbi:hypothetical protein CDL60_04835 [Roseateles noduli]|nr:hypothetical protein CDL60_04835 [Roseateles noduli]